jgi:CRISPR-associated helicase Cas3/CRISPR-associated endonuclease Cas3-HD
MIYYGHTKEDARTKQTLPKHQWQLLHEHLLNVAQLASQRADKFCAAKIGYLIGLAHDLGKYSAEFQQRLDGKKIKVDHATAGAQEINKRFSKPIGIALTYPVAGHHGGLPDGNKGALHNLPERLANQELPNYQAFASEIELPQLAREDFAAMPKAKSKEMAAFSFSFCIRMLFSCLTDADYLDTERFMNPQKFATRPTPEKLSVLLSRLEIKLAELSKCNQLNPSKINHAREEILQRCLEMAEKKPQLFTLTVPTGGGKTYSSLAFGLKHAVRHEKERIIYVIPYTSIIEQNAQVFRDALEVDSEQGVVLEHHSNFDYPEGSFEDWDKAEKAHRLAAENWDMPVVVTTAVQFFESLYANKGSRCRKLHNMANSVIILDEAQMMPIEYMKPCLWALSELVINYGATVVFCTATQPAIKKLLPAGMETQEIMADPKALQRLFKRVDAKFAGFMSDEVVAAQMAEKEQVLTVVNTRRHARLLFDKLQSIVGEGNYHLSARMCPAHRKIVLAEIKQRLHEGSPCRVVSTQLVEAGVDLDFPWVFRAAAGIDSITQAAGRCNREGRLACGEVVVFDPEEHGMPSRGRFGATAGLMRSTARRLEQFDGELLSLAAIDDYFQHLFKLEETQMDAKQVLSQIQAGADGVAFPFASIAKKFQFIDNATSALIVPWDEKAQEYVAAAEWNRYPGSFARVLQPYVVQVYQYELLGLEKAGAVKTIGEYMKVLSDPSFYDDRFGLKDAKEVKAPNDVLIF